MPYFTKNLPVFSINYQRYIFYNLKLCECCVSETINGKEGTSSHLVTIPPGPHLTDALVSSPVLQVGNRTRRKLTTNIIGLKKILIFVISFSVGIFSTLFEIKFFPFLLFDSAFYSVLQIPPPLKNVIFFAFKVL